MGTPASGIDYFLNGPSELGSTQAKLPANMVGNAFSQPITQGNPNVLAPDTGGFVNGAVIPANGLDVANQSRILASAATQTEPIAEHRIEDNPAFATKFADIQRIMAENPTSSVKMDSVKPLETVNAALEKIVPGANDITFSTGHTSKVDLTEEQVAWYKNPAFVSAMAGLVTALAGGADASDALLYAMVGGGAGQKYVDEEAAKAQAAAFQNEELGIKQDTLDVKRDTNKTAQQKNKITETNNLMTQEYRKALVDIANQNTAVSSFKAKNDAAYKRARIAIDSQDLTLKGKKLTIEERKALQDETDKYMTRATDILSKQNTAAGKDMYTGKPNVAVFTVDDVSNLAKLMRESEESGHYTLTDSERTSAAKMGEVRQKYAQSSDEEKTGIYQKLKDANTVSFNPIYQTLIDEFDAQKTTK